MTLAKSTSTETLSINARNDANATDQQRITLDKLRYFANQSMDYTLSLWSNYEPLILDKTQATWQLLRHTQPVQLLLAAALAVLSIALVLLVNTFSGLIILFLKVAALTLAAIAVGQWISLGVRWADDKLPSVEPKE